MSNTDQFRDLTSTADAIHADDESLRLLILEDVASDAELVLLELRHAGLRFSSSRAEDRESFEHLLATENPDIILADFRLPGFNALDALEIVKRLSNPPAFILVTGSQSEEIAVDCIKRGADDYILKDSLRRLPTAVVNALEKRRAEARSLKSKHDLRESEERFRLMFTNNPLPSIVCDEKTLAILEINKAASDRYGYARDEFLRMNLGDLALPGERGISGQRKYRKKDGQVVDVQVVLQTLEVAGRKCILIVAEDITDRLQAERQLRESREQLRALSAHLQSVREEERTRIAREVHDELGQLLTALRFDITWIAGKVSGLKDSVAEGISQTIEVMTGIVDATIRTVRRIATELRPGVLDDLGLISAIEWQAQEFQNRTGIKSRFTTTVADIDLDRERSTAVFRILQEALTNIARHAEASHLEIRFERSPDMLLLEVVDNGKGISRAELAGKNSLGLLGMRERALLLGGDVVIKGEPGKGTIVVMRLPLPQVSSGENSGSSAPAGH